MWTPPPRLTVSEWADRERILSPESSAEPGRWRTDRAEYLRGILDAFSDPAIHTVVVMSSAQVGKTEALLNVCGYFIDQDPSPIQCVFPTLEIGVAWSKDRLAPMLRDTPVLRGKVADAKARSAENRILHKRFAGGHLTASGANSPASLSSRPIRIVLCDEVDRFPPSAGSEGDPVTLAHKRSTTFWNRKLGLFSTPTLRGASRIEAAYLTSDQRVFLVPCPRCGRRERLVWANVRPLSEGAPWPDSASYHCGASDEEDSLPGCGGRWSDLELNRAVRHGTWEARQESRGVAGFHLNELVSPWVALRETAQSQIDAKRGGRETLKVWSNTALGETWSDDSAGERDPDALFYRREVYRAEVPAAAILLIGSVDTQDDRLELEVVGYAPSRESFGIRHQVFVGSPAEPSTWEALLDVLDREWEHESGLRLKIAATAVDTHGHYTLEAYRFCKAAARRRRVYAVRGGPESQHEMVTQPTRNNPVRVPVHTLNAGKFKGRVLDALDVVVEGPGYWHFPKNDRGDHSKAYELEFFEQLCAEKPRIRYVRGFAKREWVKTRERNEALDLRAYSLAALEILKPDWPALATKFDRRRLRLEAEQVRAGAARQQLESEAAVLGAANPEADGEEIRARAAERQAAREATARRDREIEKRLRERGSRPKRRGFVHGWRH